MNKPSSFFWSECGMLFVYQNFGLSTYDCHQHWDIILVIMLSNLFLSSALSWFVRSLCTDSTSVLLCCRPYVFSLSASGSFPSRLHQSPSYWKVSFAICLTLCVFHLEHCSCRRQKFDLGLLCVFPCLFWGQGSTVSVTLSMASANYNIHVSSRPLDDSLPPPECCGGVSSHACYIFIGHETLWNFFEYFFKI